MSKHRKGRNRRKWVPKRYRKGRNSGIETGGRGNLQSKAVVNTNAWLPLPSLGDKIQGPAKFYTQAKNFCLFYAMLNGLKCLEEQMAFCGVTAKMKKVMPEPPHRLFAYVAHLPSVGENVSCAEIEKRKDKEGYTYADMERYLRRLVDMECIAGDYVWKQGRSHKTYAGALLGMKRVTVVAFAYTSTHEVIRKKTMEALKRAREKAKKSGAKRVEGEVLRAWQGRKHMVGSNGYGMKHFSSHGIAFGWRKCEDGKDRLFLFDGGRKSVVCVGDADKMEWNKVIVSAISMWKFHYFSISLPVM
jgi:hypothetical protein